MYTYLQAGVAAVLQEDFDDRDVPFIHSYVQRSLLPSVTSIQVNSVLSEQFENIGLVPKAGMMNSFVTILVLTKGERQLIIQETNLPYSPGPLSSSHFPSFSSSKFMYIYLFFNVGCVSNETPDNIIVAILARCM